MKNEKQHYIPCVYLKGFSNYPERNRKAPIYVYDKTTQYSYPSNVEKVAREKNYYPISVEYNLRDIESLSDPILKKIRNWKLPDSHDKLIFSIFINIMITRVPFIRKFLKDKIPENISKAIEENLKEVSDPETRIKFGNRIEGKRKKLENYFNSLYGNPTIDNRLVSNLSGWKWILYYVKSESKFITCDNPVSITEERELFIPISSNICLFISKENDKEDFMLVPEIYYKVINNRTASKATRFIYYHEKKDWVEKIKRQP